MKRYRLTARAQLQGEVREPGYEFELADGERGPMATMRKEADRIGASAEMVDVPLYEEVAEQPPERKTLMQRLTGT